MTKRLIFYTLILMLILPTAVFAVQDDATGTICVNAFGDENGNGAQDANEGYVAGITFTVGNSDELVGQAVSTGTSNPVCFEGVKANIEYQVSQTLPNRLEMTTASNTAVSVEAGNTVGIQFGSRLRLEQPAQVDTPPQETQPEEPGSEGVDTATPAPANGLLAYSGLAAIVLGVLLLGVILFWLLRRQTT
ncbi:MAG: hypothetical protein AAF614_04580 [Chloroflexota bacterium]